MDEQYILGLDIGGTTIKAGLVNQCGNLKGFQTIPTNARQGSRQVLSTLKTLIQSYQEQVLIKGIGIALAGSIETARGVCLYSPNLNWRNVEIGRIIEESTHTKVRLINDANAACIGEYFYGAGINYKNIICITIGTGIGSSVILDNQLFIGSSGMAPEAGHMVLKKEGPECTCGGKGCWETLASASAIIKRTAEILEKGQDYLTLEDIFKVWQAEDPRVVGIMTEVKTYLALGLANLVNIFHPECIVLGGGVVELNDGLILAGLEEMVKELTFPTFKNGILIKKAKLGNKAGLIGAAALFLKDIRTIGGQKC